MNKKLFGLLQLDHNTNEVFKKSLPTSLVKIGGMVLTILVSIFLGRILGPEGLGIINLSNKIVSIFLIISMLGMRQVLIKEIAIGRSNNDHGRIADSLYTSYLINIGLSVIISVGFVLLSPWLANSVFKEPDLELPLILCFIVFPFQIIARIFSSGLAGFKKIWQASLVDKTLTIFFVAIILLVLYASNVNISVTNAILAYVVSRVLTSIIITVYWKRIFSSGNSGQYKGKELIKTAFPILLVTFTATIYKNIDIILIGYFSTVKELGIYVVASRIAIVSGFLLNVTNATLAPKFATLYHDKKETELQNLVQNVTVSLFIMSIFILAISVIFGKFILSIWGTEFIVGYLILVILAVGQFVDVSTGAVGTLLTMSGFERKLLKVNTFFMIFNIVLNIIMIQLWAAKGAALAFSISIIGMNLSRAFLVKKYIGISIFPWHRFTSN